MDILQLKYFQTVARYEHMTQAAKELSISQPSLSIMIGRLESELGVPLFKRTGRNIELNEAGKKFLAHVNQIFIELESGKREIIQLFKVENIRISLATTSSRFLSGLLKEFLSINPTVDIRQFVGSIDEIRGYLITENIDYCITSPPIEGTGIECVELLDDEILLGVPLSHKYAKSKSIKLQDVADDDFISLVEGYSFREITDNLCNIAGFTPNIVFECDTSLMFELIPIGRGIAFIPKSILKTFVNDSVKLLKIEEPICKRKIGLSWMRGRYLSKAAQSFQSFAVDFYKTSDIWNSIF